MQDNNERNEFFFELVILCVGKVRPAHVLYLLPTLVMYDM